MCAEKQALTLVYLRIIRRRRSDYIYNYSDITPHNEFWKVRLQEQETLLNEIHGNVAYNIY